MPRTGNPTEGSDGASTVRPAGSPTVHPVGDRTTRPAGHGGGHRAAALPPPPLVAVAHGSRDPRSAATVAALVERVRSLRPDLDVRLSFLDLSAPRLGDVLAGVHADGHRRAVVVPLLLGNAFHARVDVPEAVAQATRRHPGLRVAVSGVLGDVPDPARYPPATGPVTPATGGAGTAATGERGRPAGPRRAEAVGLGRAALRRLAEVAGPLDDPALGVVLAAAGSSHAPANAAVARTVAGWTHRFGWSGGSAAFATAAEPTVAAAVAGLREGGARRVAVALWFLAPGRLPDRVVDAAVQTDPAVRVAAPLGADEGVAALIVDRYRAAAAGDPAGDRRLVAG